MRSNSSSRDVQHRLVLVRVAGVVDHDVDAAEGLHRLADHGVDLGSLGHVDGDMRGSLADALAPPRVHPGR